MAILTNNNVCTGNQATASEQNNGVQTINPHPALTNCNDKPVSITAIARCLAGYGPTRTFRAAHNLICKATVLIFRDNLDSSPAATHIAERNGSAIR